MQTFPTLTESGGHSGVPAVTGAAHISSVASPTALRLRFIVRVSFVSWKVPTGGRLRQGGRLRTLDMNATRAFYEGVLGFKAVRCDIIKVHGQTPGAR